MTHTSTEQPELLPCPFCGAKAHFDIDDENWEWVECEGCGMQGNRSASLMEDCKPKLREVWNRRAPASKARVPLSDDDVSLWIVRTLNKASKQGKYEAIRNGVPLGAELVPFFIEFATAHNITQEKQG